MKILLIGYSGVSKSPLGHKLVDAIPNSQFIGASEWVRSQCPIDSTVTELTAYSNDKLSKNPRSCLNFMMSKYNLNNKISIIDGIRNPFDFTNLFYYPLDIVIFLSRNGIIPKSSFEKNGIKAIRSYINFLLSEKLISQSKVIDIHFTKTNKYLSDGYGIEHTGCVPSKNLHILNDLEDAVDPILKSTIG